MRRPKLMRSDYLVIASLAMIIVAHATTNYMITKLTTIEELSATLETIAEVFEAAPLTRIALQLEQTGMLIQFILIPAIIGGSYYGLRMKLRRDESYKYFFDTYAMTLFLVGVLNVSNDLSFLLAGIA